MPHDLLASFSQDSYHRHLEIKPPANQGPISGLQGNLNDSLGDDAVSRSLLLHPPASPPDLIKSPFVLAQTNSTPHHSSTAAARAAATSGNDFSFGSPSTHTTPMIRVNDKLFSADALGAQVFGRSSNTSTPVSTQKISNSVKHSMHASLRGEHERDDDDGAMSDYPGGSHSSNNNSHVLDDSSIEINLSTNGKNESGVGAMIMSPAYINGLASPSASSASLNAKGNVMGTADAHTSGLATPASNDHVSSSRPATGRETPGKQHLRAASPMQMLMHAQSLSARGNRGEGATSGSPVKSATGDMLKEFDEVRHCNAMSCW